MHLRIAGGRNGFLGRVLRVTYASTRLFKGDVVLVAEILHDYEFLQAKFGVIARNITQSVPLRAQIVAVKDILRQKPAKSMHTKVNKQHGNVCRAYTADA